jgi:hypothetical protein
MNKTAKDISISLVATLLGAGILSTAPAVMKAVGEGFNSIKSQSIHITDSAGKPIGEVKIESVIGNISISREKTDSNGDHIIYYKSNENSLLKIYIYRSNISFS